MASKAAEGASPRGPCVYPHELRFLDLGILVLYTYAPTLFSLNLDYKETFVICVLSCLLLMFKFIKWDCFIMWTTAYMFFEMFKFQVLGFRSPRFLSLSEGNLFVSKYILLLLTPPKH